MESFEFPKIPVNGLGTSKGVEEDTEIDTRTTYRMNFNGGGTVETDGKSVYEKSFDTFVIENQNHKEPLYSKRINKFSSSKAHFLNIEKNRPKKSDYTLAFRYPMLRPMGNMEKEQKNNYFYTIPNINKASLAYYEMVLTMLGDYSYHMTNKHIVQAFLQDMIGQGTQQPQQTQIKQNYKKLSKEERGFLLLKFIIDHKYVECFLRYLQNGFCAVGGEQATISMNGESKCYYKAHLFQDIVTEPLLLCTLPGFKFLVNPNGFVDQESYKKLTAIYKYQSITTRYFGHYKQGFILTKHQKYRDHVGLYHAQINYGPVLTFMYESVNPFDHLEKKYHLKIKSILLSGTENVYIKFKRVHQQNYSLFMAKVSADMKEFKLKIDKMPQQHLAMMTKCFQKFGTMFSEWTIQIVNKNNIKQFLGFLEKKMVDGDRMAQCVFWKLLFKCKILKEAKKGDLVKRLGTLWTRPWPKIRVCFRKTIATIVNKESTKIGSDKLFFDLQGLNLDHIMNLKAHQIDCKQLQDNLYESQDANILGICL